MTLTKEDLIDTIYNRFDFSKAKSARAVESLMAIMKNTLASGENVLITGFGKFIVMKKRERRGRNPQTGEDLVLRPRKVVRFRWSEVLREKMNEGGDFGIG
jgi:integration host factor subunit alpha